MSRMMDINLDDLRVLVALDDSPSLSAAAERLDMPKQTVSRRLGGLEAALGVRLLQLSGRRARLSPEGALLAERAREALRLAEDAAREVQSSRTTPSGTLRISTTQVVAEQLLRGLICEYMRQYPQVKLDIQLSERHVDLVEERFDAAIRVGWMPDAALAAVRLAPARIRYVASPAYLAARGTPTHPDELLRHACLAHPLGPGEVRWPFLIDDAVELRPVRPVLSVNSAEIVRAAALAGLGLALIAEPACAADLARGSLVSVLDARVPDVGGVWLLTPSRRRLPARVRAFVELARGHFAEPSVPDDSPLQGQ